MVRKSANEDSRITTIETGITPGIEGFGFNKDIPLCSEEEKFSVKRSIKPDFKEELALFLLHKVVEDFKKGVEDSVNAKARISDITPPRSASINGKIVVCELDGIRKKKIEVSTNKVLYTKSAKQMESLDFS